MDLQTKQRKKVEEVGLKIDNIWECVLVVNQATRREVGILG